jgi:S-ribosylhomocysteine lyase
MGCRTGFYLLLSNKWNSESLYSYVLEFLDYVVSFEGEIPGATAKECGNYKEQDLSKAKEYAKKYKQDLENYKRFKY